MGRERGLSIHCSLHDDPPFPNKKKPGPHYPFFSANKQTRKTDGEMRGCVAQEMRRRRSPLFSSFASSLRRRRRVMTTWPPPPHERRRRRRSGWGGSGKHLVYDKPSLETSSPLPPTLVSHPPTYLFHSPPPSFRRRHSRQERREREEKEERRD